VGKQRVKETPGMTDKDVARDMDRALGWAAWEGDNETVRALLYAGADVHVSADAPLWDAAMRGRADTMRILLDARADQDIALVVAAENGLIELLRELLARGTNMHAYRGLVLWMAAHNGHTETVNELIAAGVDVHSGEEAALARPVAKTITGIALNEGDKGRVVVTFANKLDGTSARCEYRRDFLAEVLIRYCQSCRIPLPRKARKSVELGDERVTLHMTL
jgi:hypothetical protein